MKVTHLFCLLLYYYICNVIIKTNIFKTKNKMTNTATKKVFLSIEQFEKYLEDCLTIITEPNERNPYYVCEYVSLTLDKSIVHIYIIK